MDADDAVKSPSATAPDTTVTATQVVFEVDAFPGADDRERILNAFTALRGGDGPKVLRFSPRDYLVTPTDLDTFDPVLGLADVEDVTIEGRGAVIVAKDAVDCRKGYFLKFERFRNLVVKDLTLTYRPAPFVQGVITAVDQSANRVTLRMDPAFGGIRDLRETPPESRFWCRAGVPGRAWMSKPGSPSWMDVGIDQERRVIADAASGDVTIRAGGFDLGAVLRGEHNWKPGDPFIIWKRAGQDGFCFEAGEGLVLEGVRVESSLHFAIKLRGVLGARLSACAVTPGKGAMISSCADGIDVQQSRDVLVERCRLVATGDDAISFLNHRHGENGEKFEQKFPPPYPETNERVMLRDNHVEGGNRNGILLLASDAEVLRNTIVDTRQYGIKFTGDNTRIEGNTLRNVGFFAAYKHIADELNTGIIGSDEWTQHGVTIRNNTIDAWHNMPALLLKSVSHAKVTGNVFNQPDTAEILARPFNGYLEGMKAIVVTSGEFEGKPLACSDVLIRDNLVRARGGWRSAEDAILVHGDHERVVVGPNRLAPAQ